MGNFLLINVSPGSPIESNYHSPSNPSFELVSSLHLQLTLTSVGGNAGGNSTVSGSRGNVLAREIGQEVSVGLAEGTAGSEAVDLTDAAKGGGAGGSRAGGGDGEELAINGGLNGGTNDLENVALGQNVTTRADLESVAAVVVPVVVDSVQKSVALNLGATTRGVVDVVTLQSDQVAGSIEVDAPVVVAIAGSRPVAHTVDVVVGQSNAAGGLGTQNDVLTTNASSLVILLEGASKRQTHKATHGNVVNPDHVGIVDSDGVATPDVLRVDVGNGDVPASC